MYVARTSCRIAGFAVADTHAHERLGGLPDLVPGGPVFSSLRVGGADGELALFLRCVGGVELVDFFERWWKGKKEG